MRLLRYGTRGREQPELLDADGTIRSLGPALTDLDASSLSLASLARLPAIDAASLPIVPGTRASAYPSPAPAGSSPSV
jgi:hypothetical protein